MRLKDFVKVGGGVVAEKYLIPPSMIKVEAGFNPRLPGPELTAHIRDLANSILEKGYDQTETMKIKFTGSEIWVRDGHCRLEAIALATSEGAIVETVACVPLLKGSDAIDENYQVLTTQTKKTLSPIEWGIQLKKLLAQGQTEKAISARLGKPRDFVDRMLELAGAEPEIKDAVHAGQIAPTEAVNVIRRNGANAGPVIKAAVAHARSEGRERARPRDVEAVTKPRDVPVSLCSLATTAVRAWRDSADTLDFQVAMEALEKHLGRALLEAA